MTLLGLLFTPRRRQNPVFFPPSVVISQPWLRSRGLVYFMVLGLSLTASSVSCVAGKPFVPGILCGPGAALGLPLQPVWVLPLPSW